MAPIETDDHVLRARRTAACTRALLGLTGIALALAQPDLLAHPRLAMVGFATIAGTQTRTVKILNIAASLAAAKRG